MTHSFRKKILLISVFIVLFLAIPVFTLAYSHSDPAFLMRNRLRLEKKFFSPELQKHQKDLNQFHQARKELQQKPSPEKRTVLLENGKIFLKKNAQLNIKMLKRWQDRISRNQSIESQMKNNILTQIQQEITFFQNLPPKIPKLEIESLRTKSIEMQEHWQNINKNGQIFAQQIMPHNVRKALQHNEKMIEQINTHLQKKSDKSEIYQQINTIKGQLEQNTANIKQQLAEMKELFDLKENSGLEELNLRMIEIHYLLEENRLLFHEIKNILTN